MSCMIATKETVSKVSYYIAMLLNQGFNSFGFCADEKVFEAFKDCRNCGRYDEDMIYYSLYSLNHKAYAGRYRLPIKEDYTKDIPENPCLRYWDVLDRKVASFGDCYNHEVTQEWHYAALKGVQFVEYQLSEDATDKEEKKIALEILAKQLAVFIACHTPEYHNVKWC